ncbi:Murein DD-endopeptidase MepM and murein hydrolase activator NlpD, contain LysM domain [Rhizobium sp. RU20A]|nr:Murein DD-endopeptidase MepM and murein hydrolase activator NlpD, contain LysM domain [Rhizobium sp. RU20A]
MTTASIPGRGGNAPIPAEDVAGAGSYAAPQPQMARNEAINQPFPDPVPSQGYDPVNTATTPVSGARMASTPVSVQRVALADPSASSRQQVLEQPMPAGRNTLAEQARHAAPDPVTTGGSKNGWTTANAPSVMVRQGDTVSSIARRFGVPEKELMKANGLKTASAIEPGQRLVVPTFGVPGSAAKASASEQATALDINKQKPSPLPTDQRDVAILPGQTNQTRDKNGGRSDVAAGKQNAGAAGEGGYEVKPGDSLNKIAKAHGVSVDALKQANGLDTASIRIGQKLAIPAGGAVVAKADTAKPDPVKTATVPAGQQQKPAGQQQKPVEVAKLEPKQSVSDAETKSDVTEASPKATGIEKYRWPVRGAVIAGYGANVDGSRNDGINISVPEGTPIKAAENGVVIYSGSSLKELGNAVLVRHDDGTVTVYGNASALNVQRGQKVQRGQTLASSGMTGKATQPQVHFEVRKNATAVNPTTYLE